jgi:uncharacterized protein (TIGR02145 family)
LAISLRIPTNYLIQYIKTILIADTQHALDKLKTVLLNLNNQREMYTKNNTYCFQLFMIGLLLTIILSCNKDEGSSKNDPIITWANPADINFGTPLSNVQLNATANVSGKFSYTPAIGAKLSIGVNQDLKVDFTPTDPTKYNTVSKNVKINVIALTVTDIDGNTYNAIIIGTQIWMSENLRTTKYRNGVSIANVNDSIAWASLSTGAYCWYNNDAITNKATYGALYNWYAVANSNNIAPSGWHVPTDTEWTTLITFLGGQAISGGKMKETGTSHWNSPNEGATNESGFTALPAGYRYGNDGNIGMFSYIGKSVYFWSNTQTSATEARYRRISNDHAYCDGYFVEKKLGFSVRCIKD